MICELLSKYLIQSFVTLMPVAVENDYGSIEIVDPNEVSEMLAAAALDGEREDIAKVSWFYFLSFFFLSFFFLLFFFSSVFGVRQRRFHYECSQNTCLLFTSTTINKQQTNKQTITEGRVA